jgi:hypothetical protein
MGQLVPLLRGGTQFNLRFPLRRPTAAKEDEAENFNAVGEGSFGAAAGAAASTIYLPPSARVVVYDPSEDVRKNLSFLLECYGGRRGSTFVEVSSEERLLSVVEGAVKTVKPSNVLVFVGDSCLDSVGPKFHPEITHIVTGFPHQIVKRTKDDTAAKKKGEEARTNRVYLKKPAKMTDFVKVIEAARLAMFESKRVGRTSFVDEVGALYQFVEFRA